MGVRYKYEPKQFKQFLKIEDKFSISGKTNPLVGTLGKQEWEKIAGEFLEKAVREDRWSELEIKDVEDAEMMADIGYLFRCRPFIKNPAWNQSGYIAYGTYDITNEALEAILERGTPNK